MKKVFVEFLFCFLHGLEDAQREDNVFGYVDIVELVKKDVNRQLDA